MIFHHCFALRARAHRLLLTTSARLDVASFFTVSLILNFALHQTMAMAAPHIPKDWSPTRSLAINVGNKAVHIKKLPKDESLQLVISLKLRNKAQLDALTNQIMSGSSLRSLTHHQVLDRHAPDQRHIALVTRYLASHGFHHISVAKNRLLITAEGTVGNANSAFKTEMHLFTIQGRFVRANAAQVLVPSHLSNIILAITGLQDCYQALPALHAFEDADSKAVIGNGGYRPTDFPLIYNAHHLAAASRTTLGIITQGDMTSPVNNLNHYAHSMRFPIPHIEIIPVGAAGKDDSNTRLWNMVTQVALAAAGGSVKQLLLYNIATLSDANLILAYNQAVSDNLAEVISLPFGQCEHEAIMSGMSAAGNAIFQIAVAQRQTFVAAAGTACDAMISVQHYPAVSPFVMAIGGTTITTSTAPVSLMKETVWHQSGGGPALNETAPDWQQDRISLHKNTAPMANSDTNDFNGHGFDTHTGFLPGRSIFSMMNRRGIPDLAFNANPETGAFVSGNTGTEQLGGTALAAALFSGFWARIQSAHNNTLPFPAAKIYHDAPRHPEWFYDVTIGQNDSYQAKSGWDFASGFGSVNIASFSTSFGYGTDSLPLTQIMTNAAPISGITLLSGQINRYAIVVPADQKQLTFLLHGGTGDGDLFVKYTTEPSLSNFDGVSRGAGNNERISVSRPKSGVYHLMLGAFNTISGATLEIRYY